MRAAGRDESNKGQQMNRGSLAEDPRVDRPSQERYSRYAGEKNSLLYVTDREWKNALAAKAGSDGKVKKKQKRVSAGASTGYDSLEVGKHGRLFGVKVNSPAAAAKGQEDKGSEAAKEAATAEQEIRIRTASEVFTTKKPARPYLDAPNPLLEKQNIHSASATVTSAGQAVPVPMPAPAPAPAPGRVSQAPGRTLSVRKMIIASMTGVLAAAYIAAGVHFHDTFYPGTEFFGINASGMTVDEAKSQVERKVGSYSLEIQGRPGSSRSEGLDDTITAEEIGLQYRDNGMIDQEMKKQFSALWPVMMIRSLVTSNHETLGTKYDEEKAEKILETLPFFDSSLVTAPRNAEIKFNEDGAYIAKEVMGTTLDEEKTRAAIMQALGDGSTYIDLNKEGLYQNPTVYSDDSALLEKEGALNKVLGADVTLDFGDRSEVLDPETITDKFLSLDMDGNYFIDPDKVNSYVQDLAARFDTVGAAREFSTSLGTTVSLEGGDYGWTLDADSTEKTLLAALEQKQKGKLQPSYFSTGLSRGADDIGDTYVEIDLTNQRMWFYKNGSLIVDTPVVTGNPLKGNETPYGGVWSLKGKYKNAVLKGQGYATPVDFWMPFNGGVGIHDLQARYYFGGSIYMGAGSHGCINTPLAAVKLIYYNISSGTPVVVYKDESEAAVSQNMGMQDIGSITANIESTFGVPDENENSVSSEGAAGQTFETDQNAGSGQKGGAAE